MNCQGKLNRDIQCKFDVIEGKKYCNKHLYFETYTVEMMNNLIKCGRCTNMIDKLGRLKRCQVCTDDVKKSNALASSKKIKCSAIDVNRNQCRNKVSQIGDFCFLHSYLKSYTKDMLEKLKICSACHKCFYSEEFKTCENCRNGTRTLIKHEKQIEKRLTKKKCLHCGNVAIDGSYCGKHSNSNERKKNNLEKENEGNKVCVNYIRGCFNLISKNDKKHTKCSKCQTSYSDYIRHAIKRGIEWDYETMTEEVCYKLMYSQCYYCGKIYEQDEYKLGIDRKDNSKGYTVNNCVTCCRMCNFLKGTHSEDNFFKIVEHILCNIGLIDNNDFHPEVFHCRKKQCKIKEYIGGAKRRNLEFTLNNEIFNKIITLKCYLCGNISQSCRNGIDRIDNNIGYYIYNCKSCCKTCNHFKNNFDIKNLMIQLIKIANFKIYDNILENVDNNDAILYNKNINHDALELLLQSKKLEELYTPYDISIFI